MKKEEPKGSSISLLIQIISLLEAVYASAGINQLLLAGKERMALGTNFNPDLALGGTGLKGITTGTLYNSLFIIGMNAFSHDCHLFFA